MATAIQSAASVSPQRSLQLALAAAHSAEDNKGQNVTVLDLRDQTVIFDYFDIATGSSQRQLRAISDAIDDVLQKELGHPRLSTEGYQDSKWILLDYGSVIVHLFDTTSRDYYALEDLWAGAKKVQR